MLEICKDKILVNVDKAADYMDKVKLVVHETGTEKQIIYKGGKDYQHVRAQYGSLLDEIIYMPIIRDNAKNLADFVDDYIRLYKPLAFEVIIKTEDSPMFEQLEKMKQNGVRIWVNSLWPQFNAGHDDERAVYEPDAAWGWIVRKANASIIQTDRPKELINYLESINRRGN